MRVYDICMYVAGVGSILCISAPSAHKRARAKAKEGEQKGGEREEKKQNFIAGQRCSVMFSVSCFGA